jgi:mannose/fructose/N-acetylgalactosamine-specific phosphotransferase system component IIC
MIKYFMSKSITERGLIAIIACVILFAFGYFFVLNYMSTLEDPPLGNTIYILLGSTISIISILGIILIVKYLYDHKKRKERKERKREKHKLFYLKDSKKSKSKNPE